MEPFISTSDNPNEMLAQATQSPAEHLCGVVYKKNLGSYLVHTDGKVIPCSISNRLRKRLIYPTADPHSLRPVVQKVKEIEHVDPLAIGDEVRYVDAQDGSGMIIEILPRRNKLARQTAVPMPGAHAFEQVIVANLDQVMLVFAAANPPPKWNLLDRYLVSAESSDLPALVCISKIDLAQDQHGKLDEELLNVVEEYRKIGYPVLLASSLSGEGMDAVHRALQGRKTALLGKSGVGKTSLLNWLQPGLGLRVKEVSQATGKGRHATTHLEMFPLDFGGAVVDTPGIREFGLWDIDDVALALYFPEMRSLVGRCKFGLDCGHDEEPGCAIRKAVMDGKISPRRYRSYLALKAGG
ncbi:MAG: ribosome small subunit-dependent GTPase A [Anaerolineales bacterium]|nr:ribosome small subunit-dependent GTPase A [Anaerolineales bacterium]